MSRPAGGHQRIKQEQGVDRRLLGELLVIFDRLKADLFSEQAEVEDGGGREEVEDRWEGGEER